jgi:hypothetical protein
MFAIKPKDSFNFKASLHAPGVGRVTCTLEGRHQTQQELQDVLKDAGDDSEACKKLVCGWSRKDFDADFSDATLAEMLAAYPGLGTQILRAYLAELAGDPKIKNSPPPAATGL